MVFATFFKKFMELKTSLMRRMGRFVPANDMYMFIWTCFFNFNLCSILVDFAIIQAVLLPFSCSVHQGSQYKDNLQYLTFNRKKRMNLKRLDWNVSSAWVIWETHSFCRADIFVSVEIVVSMWGTCTSVWRPSKVFSSQSSNLALTLAFLIAIQTSRGFLCKRSLGLQVTPSPSPPC